MTSVAVVAHSGKQLDGGLGELRALLRRTEDVRLYLPTQGVESAWRAAEERVGG